MASSDSPPVHYWSLPFLQLASPPRDESQDPKLTKKTALIILNQPFSKRLLHRLWHASDWHCCADGGANRLHDLLLLPPAPAPVPVPRPDDAASATITGWIARIASWVFMRPTLRRTEVEDYYLPDLIKGDLDSLREDVRRHYETRGVPIVQDDDQDSTDLMKCIRSLEEKEKADGADTLYDIIFLGSLSGRLDQTVHTLSYLHKLRKSERRIVAITDDNVGWVLNEGKHHISIDHSILGPTCGLLPVGVDSTVLTTKGLRWNLTKETSGFDGLMSTSNHLVPEEDTVFVETSRPIWWVAELRHENI